MRKKYIPVNHNASAVARDESTITTASINRSSVRIIVNVSLKNEPATLSGWKGKNRWCAVSQNDERKSPPWAKLKTHIPRSNRSSAPKKKSV